MWVKAERTGRGCNGNTGAKVGGSSGAVEPRGAGEPALEAVGGRLHGRIRCRGTDGTGPPKRPDGGSGAVHSPRWKGAAKGSAEDGPVRPQPRSAGPNGDVARDVGNGNHAISEVSRREGEEEAGIDRQLASGWGKRNGGARIDAI